MPKIQTDQQEKAIKNVLKAHGNPDTWLAMWLNARARILELTEVGNPYDKGELDFRIKEAKVVEKLFKEAGLKILWTQQGYQWRR